MTERKEITCIVCPIGCKMFITTKGKIIEHIDGCKCKRGAEYATYEALDPRRMLTSSVIVQDGEWPLVSVKSSHPVPKERVFAVLKEIKKITVKAPVNLGQPLLKNVARTGIDIVATKTVKKR